MSVNGVGALERGYRRTPQRETLALLAGALALDEEQRRQFETAAARSVLLRREGAASMTSEPCPDSVISGLPLALTSFVGREAELHEIAKLVRDHRLVTITGTGGVGKTQTALQIATELRDADKAVRFVGFAPVSDPSFVVSAIASALSVQEVPNRVLLETLLVYFKHKSLVLIFDNCEHVINEAARVAGVLLTGCPGLRILATSREPLRAAGEYTYRLPSLSLPSPDAARRLGATSAAAYGSMVLFTDRARALDHRFELTDENAPIVAEICRHLDGIPLAIELAAARVNSLSVQVLAEKLTDRFRILTTGQRTALPRQHTMRATIDWSYSLLSAQEQRVFERLSAFAGGCTQTTAAAVCAGEDVAKDDVCDLLSTLVDKSLVVPDFEGSELRYRLLESFREYAREKLAMRGEQEVVERRHAVACLELAERLDRYFDTEPDRVSHALAHAELGNWRAALQWALKERHDVGLGLRLVGELRALWEVFAPVEGRRWLRSAMELVDEQTSTSVLARLSYVEAVIAKELHEPEVHLASSESALARYRAVADELGIVRAQIQKGSALQGLGRVAEAEPLLRHSLETARRLGNRRWEAYILRNLPDAARRGHVAEALQIYEAMGAELGVAYAAKGLANEQFRAGNSEAALRLATGAIATFRTFNEMRTGANTLDSMAAYLISLARYDAAEECAREALDLAREQHMDVVVAWALQNLAAVAALRPEIMSEASQSAYARAARVLGFVNARLAALGAQRPHRPDPVYERVTIALRNAMGTDMVAKLMGEGAAMDEEQVVEAACEV